MILPGVGGRGQRRLRSARVLVVGAGGLGSPAALYLAAAGVGALGVVDPETVELSNLQRQVLHETKDLDRPKVESAQARLEALNPAVRVAARRLRVDAATAADLVAGWDLVVEGSDDQAAKLAVSDGCVARGRPLVTAGVVGWEGQLLVVRPRETACYRCVYGAGAPAGAVPACAAAGVAGPAAGVVGSWQAAEALRLLLGLPTSAGRLLLFDVAAGEVRGVTARRDPACRACGAEGP
jgi:adenylyltransferase/sulfurtransferase